LVLESLPWDRKECEPAVCQVRAGEFIPGPQEAVGDDGGVVCPKPPNRSHGADAAGRLYPYELHKTAGRLSSSAERLQSKLVLDIP
jgi:hypothetical protein